MPTSWLLHSIETSFGSEKKKSVLKSKDLSLASKLLMQTFTLGFQDSRAAAICGQEKTNGESFVAKAEWTNGDMCCMSQPSFRLSVEWTITDRQLSRHHASASRICKVSSFQSIFWSLPATSIHFSTRLKILNEFPKTNTEIVTQKEQ